MSSGVSPSPSPSSGSFEVTETSVTVGFGSKLSAAMTVALMSTYLWLGGHSMSGLTDTESVGSMSSQAFSPTITGSWSDVRNISGAYSTVCRLVVLKSVL